MVDPATLRTRRIVGTGLLLAIAVGAAFGGHRGTHAVQNLVVPGVGLLEVSWWLAAATFVLLVGGLVLWLRWGAEWIPLTVIVLSTVGAALLSNAGHGTPTTMAATHEFPVVALVVSALTWLASAWRSLPWIGSFRKRPVAPRHAADLPPPERCQLVVLRSLTADRHEEDVRADAALIDDRVVRRARRIDVVARGRLLTPPLTVDHGPARAALLGLGRLDSSARRRLLAESAGAPGGVPASEPGWVRLLDGSLVAVALWQAGDRDGLTRWKTMLDGPLALRRGHRPQAWWTPFGLRVGTAPAWEHATATAIVRAAGGCDDDDWAYLRQRVFASAARGTTTAVNERTVAAGRLWAELTDDEQARRILARPTVGVDPLARAVAVLAERVGTDRACLQRAAAPPSERT